MFSSGDKWSGCAARVHVLTQGDLQFEPVGNDSRALGSARSLGPRCSLGTVAYVPSTRTGMTSNRGHHQGYHSALPRPPAGEIILNLVKTVIRSKTTGKYLEANGSWTSDPAQAAGFADTRGVISAVQVHKLVSVEMVIFMGDEPGKYDVVLGLTDFAGLQPRPGTEKRPGMT